jgi:enoyl-CoA hydratase/carnithine racemase
MLQSPSISPPREAFSSLRYEVTDRIGLVTFATPRSLNSITEARLADLEAVLTVAEGDRDLGALVITGEGRAFCVGLDLDLLDRAFDDLEYFERVVRRINAIITRLEALPIPTLAAINGFTRAGGFEISLGCDFILIADSAKYGDVHTDAGVLPACSSLRLARRIGEQKAKELLWTARWLDGQEAVEFGIARKAVPGDRLLEETIDFAKTLTDKPRTCLASIKSVFQQASAETIARGAEQELTAFVRYMREQPFGREGYRAFREGRPPSSIAQPNT